MEIYKAYKFRMYPNDNQKNLIHKSFGTSRFIYNKLLEYKDKMYKENNITISIKDMMLMLPQLKEEYPFIKEVDSCLCQNTIKNLNIRKWECEKCHEVHDRDINASLNIMFEGLKKYMKEMYV